MPRASSRSTDAPKLGFGIQEGIVRFSRCRFANIQHNKADGTATTPFFGFTTDLTKLNDDLTPINEDQTESKDFQIAWGSRVDKDLANCKFRPGNQSGPEDTDPEDLGTEIGTEGNGMYVEKADFAPYADTEWMLFTAGLEKLGFLAEINYQSYAPNYEGLVIEVKTVSKEDLCKKFKVRFNPDTTPGARPQTAWDIVKIHNRPYEEKKKSAGKKASTASKDAGKTNGDATNEAVALFQLALQGGKAVDGSNPAKVIEGVLKRNADKQVDVAKLHSVFMPVMQALRIPMPKQKLVLEAIKDPAFLVDNGDGKVLYDENEKKVGF